MAPHAFGFQKTGPSARPQRLHRRRTTARAGRWRWAGSQGASPGDLVFSPFRLQPHRLIQGPSARSLSEVRSRHQRPVLGGDIEVPQPGRSLDVRTWKPGTRGGRPCAWPAKALAETGRQGSGTYTCRASNRHPSPRSAIGSGRRSIKSLRNSPPFQPRLHLSSGQQGDKAMAEEILLITDDGPTDRA